jgi:sigma-B regulation protein RsbU (phosphoserine phosphatase)
MDLDELLALDAPPAQIDLSPEDQLRLYWKYRGLLKHGERRDGFWQSTNENLAHAYEELDAKERELANAYNIMRDDLTVAAGIQESLIPSPSERMRAAFDIGIHHKQLTEVGGDYYEFFDTPRGPAVGVYDISGHGVSAALVMTFLKAQFARALDMLDMDGSPEQVVNQVNRDSVEFLRRTRKYATVNYVELGEDRLRYVCGGGYGLLVHDGQPRVFNRRAHYLGLRDRQYPMFEEPWAPGDLLALYTDGIPEAQDAAGHDYAVSRLNGNIIEWAELPAQEIVARVLDSYSKFRAADTDDITLLVLKRRKTP